MRESIAARFCKELTPSSRQYIIVPDAKEGHFETTLILSVFKLNISIIVVWVVHLFWGWSLCIHHRGGEACYTAFLITFLIGFKANKYKRSMCGMSAFQFCNTNYSRYRTLWSIDYVIWFLASPTSYVLLQASKQKKKVLFAFLSFAACRLHIFASERMKAMLWWPSSGFHWVVALQSRLAEERGRTGVGRTRRPLSPAGDCISPSFSVVISRVLSHRQYVVFCSQQHWNHLVWIFIFSLFILH